MRVRGALSFIAAVQLGCTPGGLSSNPGSTGSAGTTAATTGRATTGASSTTASTAASSGTAAATTATTTATASGTTSTSTTGGTTGSLTLAGCLDGGTCCGWDWAALDPTCPVQGSLGGWGSSDGTLYAGDVTGIYAIVFDGGAITTQISASELESSAVALVDAGPVFITASQSPGAFYEVGRSGQTSLPAFAAAPFAFGLAVGPNALFLTTSGGALALAYPPDGGWTLLWSTEDAGSPDFNQAVILGANGQAIAVASGVYGATILSPATGALCYADACLSRPSGQRVDPSAMQPVGVAVDPATGNLYFAGNSPAGGMVEAFGADGSCLFLRAPKDPELQNGDTCLAYYGPCAGQCLPDPSLYNVQLNQAAFVSGELYVLGTELFTQNSALYAYDLDAGLQLLSDAGYYALTAGP